MFIRQTRTNNKATGEAYTTHRLVRGQRIAGKVRQITLLNLGRHFPVAQKDWPTLCGRLEQLLSPQDSLCQQTCSEKIERAAQHYFGLLVQRETVAINTALPQARPKTSKSPQAPQTAQSEVPASTAAPVLPAAADLQEVNLDTLAFTQPRSVGVEHVALHAIGQLGLVQKMTDLGISAVAQACILGNLIGRMAEPASELASWEWLTCSSALGELLDVDFATLSHMRLYRASDLLMKHRDALESHVFGAVSDLFALQETVTLYDLTNTYMQGQAQLNEQAQFGRSKEKRSDCPLVTLGLVLDGSGFVRRSKTFAGNVREGPTLQVMLAGLQAPVGALVIMDAGIATQANIDWLVKHEYRYLVVRRGGVRQFDETQAVLTTTASDETVKLQRVLSEDGKEVQLYCHSAARQTKEQAMVEQFCKRFEAGLTKIAEGLQKPRGERDEAKIMQRIGRLKAASRGVGQHYSITLGPEVVEVTDVTGAQSQTPAEAAKGAQMPAAPAVPMASSATHGGAPAKKPAKPAKPAKSEKPAARASPVLTLRWQKKVVEGTMASHPGVYCLRTNLLDWQPQALWQTYSSLTDIESVFRSLKSELGLRPVFHQTQNRVDGHLFITVLAYQCVQVIRKNLKAVGIHESWATLRASMLRQQRVTVSMQRSDGRTIHVRKSTKAEPALARIYQALGLDGAPGGTKKLIV